MSDSSDSDVAPLCPKRHGSRAFSRTFVHLDKRTKAMPNRSEFNRLRAAGRVKEIAFTKNHTATDMQQLLLFHFPSLVDLDLSRLRFITSYDKGHAMSVVFRYIPNGVEIMAKFTQGPKQKVYMHWKGASSTELQHSSASSSTTTATSSSSSRLSSSTSSVTVLSSPIPSILHSQSFTSTRSSTSTSSQSLPLPSSTSNEISQPAITRTISRPTNGRETRHYLEHLASQDHQSAISSRTSSSDDNDVPIIAETTVVSNILEATTKGFKGTPFYGSGIKGGVVEEDFSWFGLGGSSSRVCREDEVVKCQQLLQMGGENTAMLPFLIHHFEELCWQAREENKGMIVVLVNSRQRGVAQRGAMLRILHKMECGHGKNWLFWVTETWSSEGRKVFHACGGDQRKDRILFLVPSTGRNATLLGEIADTETDTHDDILGNIIERAALHIREEGQQREQYAKWRQERKDQEEELENEIRKARELRISEEPQSGRQIKVVDLEGKQWMRKFKETACFQEVNDWLGSSKTIPLYFNLQRGNNVLKHCDQLQGDEVLHICEWVSVL